MDDNKVNEETLDEVTTDEVTIEEESNEQPKSKGYVKHRVERAKAEAVNSLLKDLGVESVEEAKARISSGEQALTIAQQLKAEAEENKKIQLNQRKTNQLKAILEAEKVFDSDALIHYVDIDKVALDDNGNIVDKEGIITSLKTAKPNFFGNNYIATDQFKKADTVPPVDNYDELYKKGDYVTLLSKYVDDINK